MYMYVTVCNVYSTFDYTCIVHTGTLLNGKWKFVCQVYRSTLYGCRVYTVYIMYFSSFTCISTCYSDLWSSEQNGLAKRKVSSRVCSCSWTSDGQFFALGLFNGSVTIWTKVSSLFIMRKSFSKNGDIRI